MTRKQISLLILSLASTAAYAAPPPIVFEDDFSNPEADGRVNLAVWGDEAHKGTTNGTQWVRVINENSEAFFGEANNNYLHIYKGTDASASVWVTAVDQFEGSQVMTVEFDYHRTSPNSSGPTMRFGVGDPIQSQNNRTPKQFRFEDTGFSGVSNLVEDNKTYRITWVYNNSFEPITYADGARTLNSDAYDVWVDGELVLRNHQFGDRASPNAPLGTPITSFGIGIFGTALNELRLDNLKIYGGAWVTDPTPPPPPPPIFADDFSDPTGDVDPNIDIWKRTPTNVSAPNRVIEVTDVDSDLYFGEANNNYMRIFHDGTTNANLHMTAANAFNPASPIITISFDFFEPAGFGESALVLRTGTGTAGNDFRVHEVTFNNGALSELGGTYLEGVINSIQIVMNNTAHPVPYLDGAATVAPDAYDVWINGQLILDDHQYRRGFLPVGTALSSLQFVIWSDGSNEFLIDNLEVFDHAMARTSPGGGGLTFAEWAASLPEGFRGPSDDAAGSGIPNLAAFALGLDPLNLSRDDLPSAAFVSEAGQGQISLTFQRSTVAEGVSIAVEASENLVDWTAVSAEIEVLEALGNDAERVRVLDPTNGASRRFLRLNISQD